MRYVAIGLLFLASIFSGVSFAAECKNKEQIPENFQFPETFKSAQLLSRELCLIATQSEADFSTAAPVANRWKEAAIAETKPLRDVGIDLQVQIEKLHEAMLDGLPFKTFQLDKTSRTFNVDDADLAGITDNEICKTTSLKMSCFEALDQLRVALNTTISAVNASELTEVSKTLGIYSNLWGDYFEKARSQTLLELSLNTYLYRDQLRKDEFVPPPEYQVIFLHPSIAIDYISDADDGEQQGESLVIEWVGINWWDAKLPLGLSLISTYSDRSSVEDVGIGVMFHIDNNYSIGIADHDGDQSVLISLDLLKLFEDKQSNLKAFRTRAEQYIDPQ